MTQTKSLKSILPKIIGVTFLLAGWLVWIVPLAMFPFVNTLPYLQTRALQERLVWAMLFFLVVYFIARAASTSKQWRSVKSITLSSRKDVAGVFLCLIMVIYTSASFSANIFGSLVKIFPGKEYTEQVEVVTVQASGSKYRSVELGLSSKNGKIYYLTLSQRLFSYPKFQPGNVLQLKGKENIFGVYISRFEVQPWINGVSVIDF